MPKDLEQKQVEIEATPKAEILLLRAIIHMPKVVVQPLQALEPTQRGHLQKPQVLRRTQKERELLLLRTISMLKADII
jgi:hypothetical protein